MAPEECYLGLTTTTAHAPGMMVHTCNSCDSSAREGETGDPWGWLAGWAAQMNQQGPGESERLSVEQWATCTE